jgi:hypothetical protein
MAFKNLEERFNATVNDLYAGAKLKFDGGRASTGANDDPLMVRRPGDGRLGIKQEGRSIPFNSAPRDVIRLTLFTLSVRGVAFLAKQQLLQTGNTFAQTRLVNPTFIVANAVPFLHVRRHLRPVTGKFGIVAPRDSVRANARLLGQLQPATLDTIKAKYELGGNVGNPSIRDRLKSGLRSLVQPFTDTISAITAPRDVGEKFGRSTPGDNNGWDKSRPEIGTITNLAVEQKEKFQEDTDNFFEEVGATEQAVTLGLPGAFNLGLQVTDTVPFLKYFTADPESITSRIDQMNARDRAAEARSEGRRISYIRDPLNETPTNPSENILSFYKDDLKTITEGGDGKEDDPILVSFAMGKDEHVQFRAFIRDLNQTATPDYKTYQYIGRIEKFIMYNSVQREVSFKLDLLAFSKDELNIVWKRLNYLTSFVFPYGFNKGILQPNIVRFTIGNVFVDQPGYVTSFSTNFNETAESWDIDEEVPIAATVDMNFVIIEKNTKWANKSLYGITGDLGRLSDRASSVESPSTE